MFGADTYARGRHCPRVLGSTELLAEMRRLKESGRTTNADLARLLSLPTARIAEIFDEKRRVTIDEMKVLVEHFELAAMTQSQVQNLPDRIDKAPDRAPTRDASEGETVSITSLDLSYSMGPGTNIDGYIEENPVEMDIGFLRRITRSEFTRLRIARGVGDSMYPTLLTSDVVLIDTTQNTLSQQDRVYAISLYGASAIKRLRRIGDGKVLIVSDNPSVGDQEVELADVKIDGRVIWFGRDL